MRAAPNRHGGGTRSSLPGTRESVSGLVVAVITGTTLAVAFGLLALGFEDFWITFVIGFGVLMPMALGAVGQFWQPAEEESTADRAALEELKLQYARGELTDEEFERRVGRLVETETAAPVRAPDQ